MIDKESGLPMWLMTKIEWTPTALIKLGYIHTSEEWESFCEFMEKSAMIWLESNAEVMAEDK